MGNGAESTYAYDRQRERLQGMLLTANGDSIMQTQYKYDPVDNILGISNVITPKAPKKPKGSEGRAVWIALTLYPAPILSITRQRFTKHYFIGDRRIASQIGAGIFQNAYGHGANAVTAGQKDYQMRMMQIERQREDYYRKLSTPLGVPTMKGATAESENTHVGIFYFHTDHLGFTSYITDVKANVAQFDAYLLCGELLVDEHSSTEEMPYKFNGKEFNEETGLYYYGARYMNPRTSLWYGVDALAKKYVSTGSYIYCIDNPVKFIDSDGNDILLIVWASHDGRTRHAGIAISNYKEVKSKVKVNGRWTTQVRMVQDGTYTYRVLWPGGEGAGKQNFDRDLPAVYNNKKVTLSNILNSDITGLEESTPDGVVIISSNHNVDQRIQRKLDAYELENPSYNALTNNCSDYTEAALEEAVHKELPVDEKLSSKVKATTPNLIFKASRRIRGSQMLKNPGSKINNSFIHAVSGGVLNKNLQKNVR